MENKQKNSRRRLNSLILLVAFTAIMLIISTYAWFSAQKNVTIGGLKGVVNVAEELGALTGLSVKVGNDANVAALGEAWQGGAKGCKDAIMVTLGTGVGGGIIIGGKVIAGAHGAGGEIGHITMMMDTEDTCGCGRKGHPGDL